MSANPRENKDQTQRELLSKMLESQVDIQREGDAFTPRETIVLELLVKSGGGGPAPLSRIEHISLHEDFVAVRAHESTTLLPYAFVVGVRVVPREKSRGPGFTR